MSSASDKARFYLEQSVPELKEFERKKIFTSTEITSIASKRSDFEHKINARGSSPGDYARYAEYEINLDALRRKRVKRLGIKSTTYSGQRKIFFVLDRGTRKFPGDVALWVQSIEFAKAQKAFRKLTQILTNVLRLHPTKSELWAWAAQFSMDEHGDITEARSYVQRGLRFCKSSRSLWLEYARLELRYIAKIATRRKILGIDGSAKPDVQQPEEDLDADIMRLPALTSEDIHPEAAQNDNVDHVALRKLETTPALGGAILKAIFDAAMAQFGNDPALALSFFDVVTEFDQLPCRRQILEHLISRMLESTPKSWQTQAAYIRQPTSYLSRSSPEFPEGLNLTLSRLKSGLKLTADRKALATTVSEWIKGILEDKDLDPALRQILRSQVVSLEKIGAHP